MESVILVDNMDKELGTMEKLEAHRRGLLHRAFSIVLFNSRGQVLLQKRARHKYHSGGLWTNTCCSHPLPGETMAHATRRKLKQEMGIDLHTEFAYKFTYRAELDHGLIEHECDYVFIGQYDGLPAINKDEVEDWKYVDLQTLREDAGRHPEHYTYWFRLILNHPELTILAA